MFRRFKQIAFTSIAIGTAAYTTFKVNEHKLLRNISQNPSSIHDMKNSVFLTEKVCSAAIHAEPEVWTWIPPNKKSMAMRDFIAQKRIQRAQITGTLYRRREISLEDFVKVAALSHGPEDLVITGSLFNRMFPSTRFVVYTSDFNENAEPSELHTGSNVAAEFLDTNYRVKSGIRLLDRTKHEPTICDIYERSAKVPADAMVLVTADSIIVSEAILADEMMLDKKLTRPKS